MVDRLRIATIGLGDIALKAYLPIMTSHHKVSPILCTRNTETLNEVKHQYRVTETYSDVSELLASQPDAVMIHTATASHFTIAEKALGARIPTFIDKPASFHIEQVQQLVALSTMYNTPLMLGFNRRFAPLIKPLREAKCRHIRWQKNRVNLPAEPREFIFNDFIHVIDGLRYLAGVAKPIFPADVHVSASKQDGLLSHIHVSFEHNGCLLEASMNRNSGFNEERIEAFGLNEKIQIDNLTRGVRHHNGSSEPLGFDDWQSYLYSRGFVDMIEHWIEVVNAGPSTQAQLNDVLWTHELCEHLVEKVNNAL